jgi:hypothetical protein
VAPLGLTDLDAEVALLSTSLFIPLSFRSIGNKDVINLVVFCWGGGQREWDMNPKVFLIYRARHRYLDMGRKQREFWDFLKRQ